MTQRTSALVFTVLIVALTSLYDNTVVVSAFAPAKSSPLRKWSSTLEAPAVFSEHLISVVPTVTPNKPSSSKSALYLSSSSEDDDEYEMTESDQTLLGAAGTFAALVTFYSEFTLKTTGCGLPAGPFGLVGLVEGLSYLGVTGVAAYSIVTKVKTGSGLPAGPGGILGAAEGLSFLAITVGLVVLVLQVTNFGYIPNAIPMEGGMCS